VDEEAIEMVPWPPVTDGLDEELVSVFELPTEPT
jgi:hypothetical protein